MIKINKNKNKGISLMVLLITIAVMLILLTVIVISVDNVSNNSKLSAFATDLSTIEDLTNTYYMQNNSFPVKTESGKEINDMIMTQGDLLNKVGNENKDNFIEELQLNNDYNDESDDLGEYYPIDLSKLDIGSSKRGIAKDGDTQDIYVVSYPSMNIYYIKGVKAKKDIYFSLSSKLTNRVKLNKDMAYKSDSTTSIQSIEGLTVKKMTKSWTNSMGIYVQANLNKDEDIYLEATNVEKKKLITNEGNNEFSFNDLSEVNGFTSDESNTFKNSAQSSKKIIFTKQKGTDVLGKIEVDMSNYETDLPTYSINPLNIVYSEEYNMISFKVGDSTSGVKEVRYEYLTKYNEKGDLQNYYSNISEYDEEYLKSKGKKAIADKDGNIALKIDKDIQGIQLIVIDKAGNILSRNNSEEALKIGLYNESNDMYIGLNLKENTEKTLSYSIILVNKNGISNLEIQTSSDGINYSDPKVINVNSTASENIKIVSDKQENLGKVKLLKITAIDNSTTKNKNTRIFKLDSKNNLDIGKITDESKTFNQKTTGTYYNPIVPAGFAPINEDDAIWGSSDGWNNGLVIKDENGNEFVWIPVESSNDEEFENKFITYPFNLSQEEFKNYFETTDQEFSEMKASVKKNGGFYIARYEMKKESSSDIIMSKSNLIPQGSLNFDKVKSLARSMYPNLNRISDFGLSGDLTNNTGVISTLMYGRQWDATLKFIEKDYPDYPLSSNGNYNSRTVSHTGSDINFKVKNICEMAGNLSEWTMELNGDYPVLRGGSFLTDSDKGCASLREYNINPGYIYQCGFRVALYINN